MLTISIAGLLFGNTKWHKVKDEDRIVCQLHTSKYHIEGWIAAHQRAHTVRNVRQTARFPLTREYHEPEPTLTGVKPGMSSDSRVSHTECTRGWLAEASASASPTLLR